MADTSQRSHLFGFHGGLGEQGAAATSMPADLRSIARMQPVSIYGTSGLPSDPIPTVYIMFFANIDAVDKHFA